MAEWRRKASELLPELQAEIADASSPMALWIELHLEFDRAHERQQRDLVGRILQYARWCWRARSGDTVTAVICAFFEHLPQREAQRAEIPHWFSRAEFEELRPVFEYHAGAETVAAIAQAYGRGAGPARKGA